MRVKKYAIGGTATSYPAYNDMPFVNLPEAEVLGMRTGQEINRPFWYSDNTAEWEANRMDDLYRSREAYDTGYKQVPAFMDPMSMGKAESFSPITYVHPAGDLEAILQAAGYALEGDIPSAALAGSLAAASVFLPGTFQTKSTMAGGVLERSLDKSGRIHPNAIRAIIDSPQTSDVEKHVLSSALDDALRGADDIGVLDPTTGKINYKEFKKVIGNYAPHLDASPSGQYAKEGLENVFDKEKIGFLGAADSERLSSIQWGLGDRSAMFYDNRIPEIHSRSVNDYINKNKEWFSGLDLPRGYSDGLVRSKEYIDRGRLTQFLDAVISGDDAAFEALGLPVPDFRADELGDMTLQGWKNARDFINRKPIDYEMIGLFPSSYNPSGVPVPVSDSHLYDPGFGHFRTAYDPDAPNIAYITEIQSDAATSGESIAESINSQFESYNVFRDNYSDNPNLKTETFEFNLFDELEEAIEQTDPRQHFEKKKRFELSSVDNDIASIDFFADRFNMPKPEILNKIKNQDAQKLSMEDLDEIISVGQQVSRKQRSITEMFEGRLRDVIKGKYKRLSSDYPDIFPQIAIDSNADAELRTFTRWDSPNIQFHLSGDRFYTNEEKELLTNLHSIWKKHWENAEILKNKTNFLNETRHLYDVPLYEAIISDIDNNLYTKSHLDELKSRIDNPVRKGLIKNYTERILQEAVGDIVRRKPGIKTIRIPVGETAAKIQGHGSVRGSTKKYNSMDKTIKRVFGKKPGKVTDNMGNQWWEFDLPEGGFEKQIFNRGGKINVVKKRTGKYRVIKS